MKLLCNKLLIRSIKRLQSSIPRFIVSNCATIDLKRAKALDFSNFMKNNEIKYVNMIHNDEKDHIAVRLFLYDLNSLNKIHNSPEFPFTFQTISPNDGSVSTSNRITIQHENDLWEEINSLIPKEYFISTKLPHKRFHHIYCQNEDQFNALFFQNGIQKNVLIERTHFPYIKNLTLKISPNIINVYFPEEIETEEKASNFFSDLRFNKIVKPTNPKAPWKFYLSNEADYLKMLSQPYFYMNKCLLILPYYGSPIYLYDGEKKVGNSLMIYSKNNHAKLFSPDGKKLTNEQSLFENGQITSIFCDSTRLNNLRFLNGADSGDDWKDYSMVFRDEINKFNLISPYLQLTAPRNLDISIIKSKIAQFIYDSKILVGPKVQILKILPLSFDDYLELLKFSIEIDEFSIRIHPAHNLTRFSYLSNFIFVPTKIYTENQEEIDNSIKPIEIIMTQNRALLSYNKSEITDALFRLARYDKYNGSIQRTSLPLLKSDSCLSSHKNVNIKGNYLDLVDSKYFEQQPHITLKIEKNHFLLFFQKIEHSFPYIFHQFIELNSNKVQIEHSLKKSESITSLYSRLTPASTINLLNFYGIKYTTNEVTKGQFQLKIETMDDLFNVISMVDEFENSGFPHLKFSPGQELANL